MRTQIKVYMSQDWIDAIEQARGEQTLSDFVRSAIKKQMPKDVRKQLNPIKMGRPQNDD